MEYIFFTELSSNFPIPGNTPELRQLKPRSAGPTEYINFFGLPKVRNSSEIESMRLGPFICDRLELDEEELFDLSNPNTAVQCRVALEMEAGLYSSSFTAKALGDAYKSPGFSSVTLAGQPYDFQVIPLIKSVSANQGSPQGQIIRIGGNGFSPNPRSIRVMAGSHPCNVLSSSVYELACEVQNETRTQAALVSGVGITHQVYDASSDPSLLDLGTKGFQTSYWSKSLNLPLKSSEVETEMDRFPISSEYIYHPHFP